MSGMRRASSVAFACVILASFPLAQPGISQGQAVGTIEIVARVTPTGARPEPVRQLTFYLLRKSFHDIQKEAEQAEPKPDLDKFIEGLGVSPELRAWMKKQRSVELAGGDFLHRLKPDDILGVPEFYEAYLKRHAGEADVGFPTPKYRESDRQKNPQKYEKQRKEYRETLRRFMASNPQTVDGIELHLDAINPGQKWVQLESDLHRRIRTRTLRLAQAEYLQAKADTDLDGRAAFAGVPAGEYWLSTLETEAVAGDTRLRWDLPATVRAGETTRLELSNLNSLL
jgi:hypothetical protein